MGRLIPPSNGFGPPIDDLMSRVPAGLLSAALVLEGEWKQVLLTPGRGRVYGKRKHQASAPGDPPAPDSGTLQRSITHEVVSETQINVGTNVEYADVLEFGTTNAGRNRNTIIAPRPHARPAFARAKPAMTPAIVAELRRSPGNA